MILNLVGVILIIFFKKPLFQSLAGDYFECLLLFYLREISIPAPIAIHKIIQRAKLSIKTPFTLPIATLNAAPNGIIFLLFIFIIDASGLVQTM